MSDIPTADAPLDPDSARLDSLDYEAYRDARKEAQTPTTTVPPVTEPPPPTETPGPTEPEPEPPPQDEPPQRDETGKFIKKPGQKPRDNVNARLQELTYKQKQAEERAEAAERRARELEDKYQRHAPSVEQAPPPLLETRQRPTIEQFSEQSDPYLAWQEALVDWKLEQRDAAMQRQYAEQQSYQRWNQHIERVSQFRQEHPDWESVIQAPTTPLSAVMMTAIVESAKGPEIAYYLGTHPEVLAQLAQESYDSHVSAAPVMRRYLESVISSPSPAAGQPTGAVQATRHSRAAPPPTPVGNGSPAARDESPENEPYEAYCARRKREWAAQRR